MVFIAQRIEREFHRRPYLMIMNPAAEFIYTEWLFTILQK
jgi:hypothetical protein